MAIAHKDIRIELELGGQLFEAVGFLKAGEESVVGEEALRRCDNGHLVKSEEDWRLVYGNMKEFPWELRYYWLATARTRPGYSRCVSGLAHVSAGWCGYLGDLGDWWNDRSLVLRRRVI